MGLKGRLKIGTGPRLRRALFAAVAIASATVGILAYATNALRTQDLNTIDTRFSIRGTRKPGPIVLVKIDDKTFAELNQRFPFPRAVEGRVLSHVAAQRPAAVTFDVQLSEPSPGGADAAQNDEVALLGAIQDAHGRAVFSTTETDGHGGYRFLGSDRGVKLLGEVGGRAGNGLFPFDPGSVVRRMSYSIGGLPSLSIATAEVARHRHIGRTAFGSGSAWIDFAGPAGTFPSISFSDVYSGRIPRDFFRNKIVIVGATAPSLQDIHPTSTDPAMTGPEIQANAVDTVLRGFPLAPASGLVNILLILALACIVPLISLRLGPLAATSTAVALGVIFTVAVQVAFNHGWIVTYLYPMAALVISGVGSLAVQLVTEAFERLRVRDLFTRFVPEEVVDEVLASADGLRLGGVQREGTVMFTDLRGFTSFAESLTPARVIDVLNHYLSEMSDAILNNGGTLVAYMGDGIFAVFGAPLELANHADRALATAREMLDVRLPRFNAWLQEEGLSSGFRMGIGLNSGHVMSGHVGSERRVEYAAVGDTTNTASRIESMTKGTPHQLLLSGSTRAALLEPADDLVFWKEVEIRGRVNRMELWGLQQEAAEPGQAAAAPADAVAAEGAPPA